MATIEVRVYTDVMPEGAESSYDLQWSSLDPNCFHLDHTTILFSDIETVVKALHKFRDEVAKVQSEYALSQRAE